MKIFTPYPFDCANISSVPDREGASAIVYRKHVLVVCGGAGYTVEKSALYRCVIWCAIKQWRVC